MRIPAPLVALAVSVFLTRPILAADPDDEAAEQAAAPESQWAPPPPPPPGGSPGSSEGDYASPDRRRMDESRRKDVLDQLCRKLKLKRQFNLGSGRFPVTTLGFSRRMEADFDNSLALIDEETLRVNWSIGEGRRFAEDASAAVSFGAGISGKSMVIRRLGTFGTCNEVDRLIDLTDIKLVIPVKAHRIQEMTKGELWRIPLTVNVGYGGSVSDVLANDTVLSFGYGKAKSGTASMTLWRLSEKQARFRFRLDYVQVYSKSAGVNVTLDPIDFATNGGNILSRLLKKEIAKQLHRYSSAYVGLNSAKSDGRRLVLEYVIDPSDPAAAEAMAEAIRGNFRLLMRYARKMGTSFTTPEETLEAYTDLQNANTGRLGDPTYAARSDYRAHARTFSINLPFIVNRTLSESLGRDTVTRFTGDEGAFDFHTANRTPNAEYFNAPFLGPLVKDLETRHVDVITHAPKGQGPSDPMAVYIHNQGFLRMPVSSVGSAVEDANAILRLTGAARRGGAPDPTMELPARKFIPEAPKLPQAEAPGGAVEPSDQKGWLSFTMVMNRKAVKDALSVSTEEVLKAFARSVPLADRDWAQWLVANGRLEDGRLAYDQVKARRELGISEEMGTSWLDKLGTEAAGLAQDLAAAAGAATPEGRAEALAKALSHKNASGLKPHEILRVLVQFMDPLDVTGDFVSATDGGSKSPVKVAAHYQLKEGRAEVPMLKEAGETRGRFADGSVLTD